MTDIRIRPARPTDDAAIEHAEVAADALLIDRFGATDWPPPTPPHERASVPGFVLVAEHSAGPRAAPIVVGFVHVLEIEGHAHLEQLSVIPDFGRRGIGRRLVMRALTEAKRRGYTKVTLRTYIDVPWNAPFYASCGFVASEPETPAHRRLVDVEEELGLLAHGGRIQMTTAL